MTEQVVFVASIKTLSRHWKIFMSFYRTPQKKMNIKSECL